PENPVTVCFTREWETASETLKGRRPSANSARPPGRPSATAIGRSSRGPLPRERNGAVGQRRANQQMIGKRGPDGRAEPRPVMARDRPAPERSLNELTSLWQRAQFEWHFML